LYIFPIYLALAEYLVREFLFVHSDGVAPAPLSIVGPSIVAAGMALLFPVLVPKPPLYRLSARAQAELEQRNLAIYSVADQHVTFAAWICLVIWAGVWIVTLYVAHENPPPVLWQVVPVTMLVGGGAYATGILLTELKGF
jgi:hypothetical protein